MKVKNGNTGYFVEFGVHHKQGEQVFPVHIALYSFRRLLLFQLHNILWNQQKGIPCYLDLSMRNNTIGLILERGYTLCDAFR